MPESTDSSASLTPELIISKPGDEVADKSGRTDQAGRRRSDSAWDQSCIGPARSTSEWYDVDESPPRKRKSSKPSSHPYDKASRLSSKVKLGSRSTENEVGRSIRRLGRIPEVSESITSSRASTRGSDTRRRRDRSPRRRRHYRDDFDYRRPVQHRSGGTEGRLESLVKANPSLLSVLSSSTRASSRSSGGSSSTITQDSFYRKRARRAKAATSRQRDIESDLDPRMTSSLPAALPNVFDYLRHSTVESGHENESVVSCSSSSHSAPSAAGSSDCPGTPSSRSTVPSPTMARSYSNYDKLYAAAMNSVRDENNSPDPSAQGLRQRASMSHGPGNVDEEGPVAPRHSLETDPEPPRRVSSGSPSLSRRGSERQRQLQQQGEEMRQHVAHDQQGGLIEPIYGQRRSYSASSAHSDLSARSYQMAMQQLHWPSPPVVVSPPLPTQNMNGHIAPHEPPPAPDAPDLSQQTLTGYEMLARELSTSDSPVSPLYRKFEYLNHRILLHLQDELGEFEEQLRALDEIIAQMHHDSSDGQKSPASRRAEAFHGLEIYQRRTQLLGRIFMKVEQYNKAMSAYASMMKDTATADDAKISAYREWMSTHAPIHEVETRFLLRKQDLIVPGEQSTTESTSLDRRTKHAALAYLPVALMLPLLLYSIIPTFIGRLIVSALIAVGAFIVAATTRVRHLLPAREWAVCGAVYVLIMAAIAGCIPQHAS